MCKYLDEDHSSSGLGYSILFTLKFMSVVTGNFTYQGIGIRGLTASLNFLYDSGIGSYRPVNASDFQSPGQLDYNYDSITTYPPVLSKISSTGFTTGIVIKNTAGTLFSLKGYSNSTSTQFVHIYDSGGFPANGKVPSYLLIVAPSGNFDLNITSNGIPFTSGITVYNSVSGSVKSIGGSDTFFSATYI